MSPPQPAEQRRELESIAGAIELSAHVLVRDPSQLGSQLLGRLLGHPEPGLARLRAAIVERPVLLPLLPGLDAPGGPSLGVLAPPRTAGGSATVVVPALTLAPDGRSAVVGYEDGQISAIMLDGGLPLWSRSYDPGVVCVAADPAGGTIVSGASDGTIRMLDLADGDDLGVVGRHDDSVLRVALSPTAHLMASCSQDMTVRMWDLAGRAEIGRLPGPGPIAFGPDGLLFAVADGELASWDARSLTRKASVAEGARHALALAVTPDARRVLTVEHEAGETADRPDRELNRVVLTVYDPSGREAAWRSTDVAPATGMYQFSWATLAVSPDGSLAVTGSLTGDVLVWELDGPGPAVHLSGHTTQALTTCVTPDAQRVLTAGRDGTVRQWDLSRRAGGRHVSRHPAGEVDGVAVTEGGHRAVTVASDGSAARWDLRPLTGGVPLPQATSPLWAVAVSSDGRRAVIGGSNGQISAWDLDTCEALHSWTMPGGHVQVVGCSADGSEVWGMTTDGTRARFDATTGALLEAPVALDGTPLFGLAASADGRRILSGSPAGEVFLDDLSGSNPRRSSVGRHDARVSRAAITPDGRLGLTGSANGEITLWDLDKLGPRFVARAHEGAVTALAFASAVPLAVTGGWDHAVVLWDLLGERRLATFTGEGRIIAVDLSADGSVCVAGEQTGRVHALLAGMTLLPGGMPRPEPAR